MEYSQEYIDHIDKYKEQNNDSHKSESFYENLTNSINKSPFNTKIEPILKAEEEYHYLCPNCHKFPFVEFTKSKKRVKFTCSCYNDKEIAINELFEEKNNYITIDNISDSTTIKSVNNYHKGFKCQKCHKDNAGYFCEFCLLNLCKTCMKKEEEHNYIELKAFKIDNDKLNAIITSLNQNNNLNDLSNINDTINLNLLDSMNIEKVSGEEINNFCKFIRIIIKDYKNYPNIMHHYNIINILHFFNSYENKVINTINSNEEIQSKEKEEIIMEYLNNNSNIYLFNENFVKNNKDNVYLVIDGETYELMSQFKPKSNEMIITVHLVVKENIFEIDMSEMFSNCKNLLSINGISKWKKAKIINQSKMFYNCTSLTEIIDINNWNISEETNNYLMFYNCISLIFFPNSSIKEIKKIYAKKYHNLGIFISKYLQNGKKILLKTMIEKDKNKIILYKNELNLAKDNIIVFNGNDYNLILYDKNSKINKLNNEMTFFYKNEIEANMKEIEIILITINKLNIYNYIYSLPKISEWNTRNVTNMGYMFYNCSHLSFLPDISKWNTSNVTDMRYMFYNCSSLKSLPDISNWNTRNVRNMSLMFYGCESLKSLPDISKWNTKNVIYINYMFAESKAKLPDISKWNINNITDMSGLFFKCKSLSSLPDISKWNINNVTGISCLFCECQSLSSLPDISKWNTNKATDMSYIFYNCKSLSSLPDISKWNTKNVIDMSDVFCGCESLTSLPDISEWKTNNVTNMSGIFHKCKSLISLPEISKWKTNKVLNLSKLFSNCQSLKSLPDISKWNMTNATHIRYMFSGCESLISLPNISVWKLNNIENINMIFSQCKSLTSLPDISKWELIKVRSMNSIFYDCKSLSSLPDLSKWKTNNVINMSGILKKSQTLIAYFLIVNL